MVSREALDRRARALERLLGRPGVSAEVIQLRIALLRAQTAVALQLPPPEPGADRTRTPGAPGLMIGMLQETDRILQAKQIFNDQLRRFLQRAQAHPETLVELASRAAAAAGAGELADLSPSWGLPAASLLFLGRALCAPFRAGVAPAQAPQPAEPGAGRCPACGSPPAAAVLVGEAGSRRLCCPLCATRWDFPRTACPFCQGNAALQTLRVASEPGCWVESCERCGGYLKTFDWRDPGTGGEPDLLVATCATLHLDLLAEQAGLRPAIPYTALR